MLNKYDNLKEEDAGNKSKTPSAYLALLVLIAFAVAGYSLFHADTNNVPANDIKKITSYAELQEYVKASSDAGYSGGGMVTEQMAVKSASISESGTARDAAAPAPTSAGSYASDYSRTNIQVEGVDEADIVKNDGKYIYTVAGNKVVIVDAYPAESAKRVSQIDFNGTVNEIFVNGDKLIVFGQRYENYPVPLKEDSSSSSSSSSSDAVSEKMIARPGIGIMPPYYSSPKTYAEIYDISDRSNPSLLSDISVDGNYYNSRMIGDYIYLIANQPMYYAYSAGKNVSVPVIYSAGKPVTSAFPEVFYFEGVPANVFTTVAAINLGTHDVSSKVILTNYAQNMYVSEKNIYITYTKWISEVDYIDRMVEIVMPLLPSDVQAKISKVMDLDVSKQLKWQAVQEILQNYTSYLSDEERQQLEDQARDKIEALQAEMAKEREKTVVQKISIDNGNINYVANGEVPGNVLNQFSMDEYNGYFRIATTTSGNGGVVAMGGGVAVARTAVAEPALRAQAAESAATTGMATVSTQATPPSQGVDIAQKESPVVSQVDNEAPSGGITAEEQERISQVISSRPVSPPAQRSGPLNHVYILDENLKIRGKLEDLASGERIYSARFMGDRAYMVTFRQMDPLFVIDLSNPQDPKVLGYLKIPGVSDYLHPYDETHIIGVGRDATDEGRMKGIKLALFDVSDVANPKEISKYLIGDQGTYSDALNDHKAFLFSKEKSLLVLPVSEYTRIPITGKPEWEWQGEYWQGAYVFNVDLSSGITLKGKITHANETALEADKWYYDYLSQIRRSLYIDNVLYTVSQRMIKMNSLDNLAEINKVELPIEEQRVYSGILY